MNELEALQAHGVVSDPDPAVIRRAREQLMSTITTTTHHTTSEVDEPTPRRSTSHLPGPRRSSSPRLVLGVAAAAIAIAALAVTLLAPGQTRPAAAELRRLAQTALGHDVGTGTVAHTRSIARWNDVSVDEHGVATNLSDDTEREAWIAPDGSGRIIETRGGRRSDERFDAGGLSYTSFAGWPTSTGGVLERLRSEARGSGMRPVDTEAFVLAGDALRETAAPAAVRAAVFRAIAELDGVRSLGSVRDHLGRTGVGFEIDSDSAHDSRFRLIFDPATSALLGEHNGSASRGLDDSNWAVYSVSELVASVPPGGERAPTK